MADKINNIQNLDQIIFYTGQYSIDAASYVANRDYGKTVEGLGVLSYNSDYEIFYTQYPNVKYTEKKTNYANLNDLYSSTLSYLYTNGSDFSVGDISISQNRYHAQYSYETDLDNYLENGEIFISRDLNDFLIGLNTQVFNKQKFYGDKFEVSSIKIDNTYYDWYPKDTVAYSDVINKEIISINLTNVGFNTNNRNVYLDDDSSIDDSLVGKVNDEVLEVILEVLKNNGVFDVIDEETGKKETVEISTVEELTTFLKNENKIDDDFVFNTYNAKTFSNQINDLNLLENTYYLHATANEIIDIETEVNDYIIGDETGNYYSYVRQVYIPIENTLKEKITQKLDTYKEEICNNDDTIYAYYADRCNLDIELLLSTLNFGVKQSTFKIGLTSRFSRWFDDTININANISSGDDIIRISSYKNGEIFTLLKDNIERICGDNVEISNKNVPYTFISNIDSTVENTINILTPGSIETLDLSPLKTKISNTLNLTSTGWHKNNLNLKNLILDDGDNSTVSNIDKIFGLNELTTLEYIDLSNLKNLKITPAIDKLENLKVFKSFNSNIDSFRPKKGITLYDVELSESVKSIKLDSNTFDSGELNILGSTEEFDGVFDYTPTKNLISLTLRNIDNAISYKLVNDWYDVLDSENLLDTMIYLELQGISWKNVPVQRIINLRKFDLNPNFSGEVSIIGSGNYKWLTRNEYKDIVTLYGVNAFLGSFYQNGKTFKNLVINNDSKIETFEYTLSVKNPDIEQRNIDNEDDINVIKFKDTLRVKFNQYDTSGNIAGKYDSNGNLIESYPYYNRAATSLLDIINDTFNERETFNFNIGELGEYAYCKLDRSIDTSSSNEIRKIKAGDILLLNGDTLIIFFTDKNDNTIEYVKIGEIVDEKVKDRRLIDHSSIKGWFDYSSTEIEDKSMKLEFIPSEREIVIQELTISELSEDKNIIYNNNLDGINIAVDIDDFAKDNLDQIKITDIVVEVNIDNVVDITELGEENRDNHYRVYNIKPVSGFEFNNLTNVKLTIYCPAEKDETAVIYNVLLRKLFVPSTIEDEVLILNNEMYSVEDETLIINSQLVNVYYDETDEILTID